mgnify:CR=1 FL=1
MHKNLKNLMANRSSIKYILFTEPFIFILLFIHPYAFAGVFILLNIFLAIECYHGLKR